MSNILSATKYQLTFFKSQSLLCISIIAFNILISLAVTYLFTGSGVSAGSSDVVAIIWIFIMGVLSFSASFKFMLANAVSRKSLFWANILSMVITSATWAVVITLVLSLISKLQLQAIVLYPVFYKDNSILGAIVWFFGIFFLLIVLGWFITMVYYRSSKRMAYAITLAPFILSGLLLIINQETSGKLFDSMSQFYMSAMGFSDSLPNPYIASFSMLLLALIICAFNYLLIRRAQIKD